MEVRTFFLARSRVVPSNYRHVLVNPLKIDWLSTGANYREVITAAVDADSADGRAFVTEYAGTSDVVARGLLDARWNADVFLALPETEVLPQLVSQGLLSCFDGPEGCITQHPVVEPLLVDFLLGPSVTMGDYWTSPESYAGIVQWQPEQFAAAMADRIVEPARNADALLDQWPYVTRMYTTISPHEMTADPIFHENPDLPDVVSTRMADRRLRCDGDSVFTLPDGREVYLPSGAPWPEFDEQMPWEEEIDEMPQVGGPMNLVDNTDAIDDLLRDYNAALGWPTGCGQCRAGATNTPAGLAFLGLLALGLRRRRRG
jgi:MYXO-CTERM domain-containing protein